MDQLAIALTGAIAIWLSQDSRESWRRYACLLGLAGQPFWFYATYTAEQWGIFALCTLYLASWLRGVWNHWIRPWHEARSTEPRRHFAPGTEVRALHGYYEGQVGVVHSIAGGRYVVCFDSIISPGDILLTYTADELEPA